MLTDNGFVVVAVNALGSRVPGGNAPVHIQQEERVILLPLRTLIFVSRTFGGLLLRLGVQDQQMPRLQDVSFGCILNVPRVSIRGRQTERAFLLTPLQKITPKPVHLRLKTGVGKVVNPAADDFLSGKFQQLAGAGTGIDAIAVVAGEKNGVRGAIQNRPE